jgi:hypothetical protein
VIDFLRSIGDIFVYYFEFDLWKFQITSSKSQTLHQAAYSEFLRIVENIFLSSSASLIKESISVF